MRAAPEVHPSEPPVGRVPDSAEHSGSLLPGTLAPGSAGTLAVNRGSKLVLIF